MNDPKTIVPVVGIGASAGGIEALELFFAAMPVDTGMAFVIVTHLSPKRESILHEIVSRFTRMQVVPARDGAVLEPDCVFVMPENALIDVEAGHIRIRQSNAVVRERKPIDIFLSGLATDRGEYAIGVILSGGDSDGTLGIKAIKERGGLTLAQVADGSAPKHPDMPQSAIRTGLVDFAIPVQEMASKLVEHSRGLRRLNEIADVDRDDPDVTFDEARREVYAILRNQLGHDFSGYKTRTFNRRLQRRMQVTQSDKIEVYVERLRQEPAEVAALFRDLLITVTNFFRDGDAFEALNAIVIPKIFEGRGAEDSVRIWIPGCATGEEVYSIAMLLREHMDTLRAVPRVQIFATDIDDRSLSAARAARYPEALLDSVSPERRRRFFTLDGGSYVVAKDVRDLCIFSPHSVIRDPPFSRMDLVSCRNLLIYFGQDVQGQVIPIFHYSLRPGGYLFLGTSENVSQYSELFTPLDKKQRVFRAREDVVGTVRVPLVLSHIRPQSLRDVPRSMRPGSAVSVRQSVEDHVLERFAPPHVVVNADGDVVYYSARTGKYLEAATGSPSRQLVAMARRGLRLEIRGALREALESRQAVVRPNLAVDADEDRVQILTLTVEPLPVEIEEESLFLVVFTDQGPLVSREVAVSRVPRDTGEAFARMERELREGRDRIQSVVEEYETALEELKSSNEELVSVNEELQSTNEELEASKEELQSLNEELQTVNVELNHKVDALDQSTNDLYNLFENTQIATVFLDSTLAIRNFTPPLAQLFALMPGDKGRPIADFSSRLAYPLMHEDVRQVLQSRVSIEKHVDRADGQAHFLARLRPYVGVDKQVEGVVITFVDVTVLTRAESQQRVLVAELNHRVKNMLTIVIGLARQTARKAPTLQAFSRAFVGRLEAMARSYELLSRESWKDASIEELVGVEVALIGADRVTVQGPAATLRPKQALSFGMVIHELATNALRHGSLTAPDGRLAVIWSIELRDNRQLITLDWRETGGPSVDAAMLQGFGLKLIERETAYGMGGEARIVAEPTGLAVQLTFSAE